MAWLSAVAPPGRRTPGCACQPTGAAPTASSRAETSSCDSAERPAAAGPDDDPAGRPRCLQLDLARHRTTRSVGTVRFMRWRRRSPQPSGDVAEALQRLGEIGDHLITLVAGQRSHRPEIVLGLPDQRVDHSERRLLVRTQDGPGRPPSHDHQRPSRSPIPDRNRQWSSPIQPSVRAACLTQRLSVSRTVTTEVR